MVPHYVFLNPDGLRPFGLGVIVQAPTGVMYGNQCDGHLNEMRWAEGFFVPLHSVDLSLDPDDDEVFNVEHALFDFFKKGFRGHPYMREVWTPSHFERLALLVSRVPMWHATHPDQVLGERLHLALDRERLDEVTEAWVPVLTPYGPGILVFENCD
ncbi:DUF6210 family protein [Corallococcus sp. BB11-1]|uniref:DUF6210 family protein n=1 Tax=Corallococcus sp. BB11-1 TaxID=2996783 RepID=UPI00226E77E0|nr:DUF6210 family protein [Corallococcus sp. BB11-1]MCY1030791.1 DUF6210 family protein [Corallococcus sp. BB11-1]